MTEMARAKKAGGGSPHSDLASRIAERWRNAGEVELDRLLSELGDVERYDLVAALKELEKSGVGEFIVGRGRHKARFVWSAPAKRTATKRVAAAPSRKPVAARTSQASPPSKTAPAQKGRAAPAPSANVSLVEPEALEHTFHLRPGFIARVRLPSDVSAHEMDRLCRFLQAIPFDGDESEPD